jgi:hypothetical protein
VVQSLVSIFVESSLGATRKDTDHGQAPSSTSRSSSYEPSSKRPRPGCKEFRLRNLDLQGVDGRDSAARLAEISEQLSRARCNCARPRTRATRPSSSWQAERRSRATWPRSLLQESAINVATPEIDARIDAQKRNLDGCCSASPTSIPTSSPRGACSRISRTRRPRKCRAARQAAMAAPPARPVGSGAQNSLALQELGRMLATTEVQVAALRRAW